MKKIYLIVLFFIIIIFRNWFGFSQIIGGDWPYLFTENIKAFSTFPPAWSSTHGNGLGGQFALYPLDTYLYLMSFLFVRLFDLPWVLVYKFFWFGLFLILSSFSFIYLFRKLFPSYKTFNIPIAVLLFLTNTYILMVVGGGQMGIALAYSLAPFVFGKFISVIKYFKFYDSLFLGFTLSLLAIFDLRIFYITLVGISLYYLVLLIFFIPQKKFISFVLTFIIPFAVVLLLNFFWIFPLVVFRQNPIDQLGDIYKTVGALKFFSFGSFSQSISLLHPNWPENVFGKVSFMKSEFLILPILSYSSLFFLRRSSQKSQSKNNTNEDQFINLSIIFFILLGLIGAFLAKGANSPLGEIYIWMFQHFPGFIMFRDPTKFYFLVVLSYSILIPFTISSIYEYLNTRFDARRAKFQTPASRGEQNSKIKFKSQNYFSQLFLFITVIYLLFLIRPAVLGGLGGTFRKQAVPNGYIQLKDLLVNQNTFFRTLWLPRQQRFGFSSELHPAVEANVLFESSNSAQLIKNLQRKDLEEYISNLSIKYLIIPDDSLSEIFLNDGKYYDKEREAIRKQLDKINFLKKKSIGKLLIYETKKHKDHFWLLDKVEIVDMINDQSDYILRFNINKKNTLVFSERYSPNWFAEINGKIIQSSKSAYGLNSFELNTVGYFKIKVFFVEQKYYNFSQKISLTFLLLLIFLIIFIKIKNNKYHV